MNEILKEIEDINIIKTINIEDSESISNMF